MYFASRIINSLPDLKKKNNYFCTLITAPLISFSMELSRILITFTLLKIFLIPIYSLDKQHYTLHTALHSLEYASGFHPEICIFVRNASFTMAFSYRALWEWKWCLEGYNQPKYTYCLLWDMHIGMKGKQISTCLNNLDTVKIKFCFLILKPPFLTKSAR